MADELIDIYDSEMNLLGVAMKSQAHKEGLWHKAFHCWIISEDGNIWLQLRGADKDLYPNLLDISCAGHIQVGETPKAGGLRELEEELGLHLKESDLIKMFTHKIIIDTPIHNREFNPTYLLKTQAKLADLKLQPEEVDGVYEADIQDLIDLFFGDTDNIVINGIKRTDEPGYREDKKIVTKADFCPHGDKYYQKAFTSIQRFIDNQ